MSYSSLSNSIDVGVKELSKELLALSPVYIEDDGTELTDSSLVVEGVRVSKQAIAYGVIEVDVRLDTVYGPFTVTYQVKDVFPQNPFPTIKQALIYCLLYTDEWVYDLRAGTFENSYGVSISSELFDFLPPIIKFARLLEEKIIQLIK